MVSRFISLAVLTCLLGFILAQEAINLVPAYRVPFNLAQGATQYFALAVPGNDDVVYSYIQCTTTDLLSFSDQFELRARLNALPTATEFEARAQVDSIVREAFATKEILIPANVSDAGTWNFAVQNTFTDTLDCSILAFANALITPEINTLTSVQLLPPSWQFFNVRVPGEQILTVISTHSRVEFLTYELAWNVKDDGYPLISSPGLEPDVYFHQRTEVAELIIPNLPANQNYFMSSYVMFNGIPVNVPIDYEIFFNLATERPLSSLTTFEDSVRPLESDYFSITVENPGTALFISVDSDTFVEPLVAFMEYPTLKQHLDLFAEYIAPAENATLSNGTHAFNYRAVLGSDKVQVGDYHIRVANFLENNVNYAITYELVDEMPIQWNQEISAVLSANRSNSYLVSVNTNGLMLNIVTQSNSDFVIMVQNDAYPSDFDYYEFFMEDTWVDPQNNKVNKHIIVRPPADGTIVGTWHILVQHKRDQLEENLEYSLAVFGTTERPLDEYSLTSGTLPRGGFDFFRLDVPAELFNWYIVIEGSPSVIDGIVRKGSYPTTQENTNDLIKQSTFLSEDFAITELLIKSNVLEEGAWFLRLANNIPFASEESPAGAVQYSMRSHYAEVTSIEVGADATDVSLNGNRLAFLRMPVQSGSETLSITFSPADVQVIHRYGEFPLTAVNEPFSQVTIAGDAMTVTIDAATLTVGNHFFRVQANSLLRSVTVRASFVTLNPPTGVAPVPEQQTPVIETPHAVPTDNETPAAREGLNGYQIALVVIIVVFFVLVIGLLSVIVMQRNALKRATGAGKSNLEYTLLEK